MHRPIGLTRPHGHGSRVVSLQTECTDFKRSARTSSRPCRMPVGSLGRRGAIHATDKKNMHVSCQLRRFFSKKMKNRFFRPRTSFSLVRPSSSRPLKRWGGGAIRSRRWGDLPQGVGQITPPPAGRSPVQGWVAARARPQARGQTLPPRVRQGRPAALGPGSLKWLLTPASAGPWERCSRCS